MDKIWYRNPSKSEIIDRCGGDEKMNDQKSNAKKKQLKLNCVELMSFIYSLTEGKFAILGKCSCELSI